MSHLRLDRFICDRCKVVVDLEMDLVPEGWRRTTITEALIPNGPNHPPEYSLLTCTDCTNALLRLLMDPEAVTVELHPHDCAACHAYQAGESVQQVHDHNGAGDEWLYDKRDGYVATKHYGVGRPTESACGEQVGIETLTTAPDKVTCRNCRDFMGHDFAEDQPTTVHQDINAMFAYLSSINYVHRADWSPADVRPICSVYEYEGHDGPCLPLGPEAQLKWDADREVDHA